MTTISEQFIKGVREELEAVDFDAMYKRLVETRTYDRCGMRRLCILSIYLADERRLGSLIPIIAHYESLLRDEKYVPILEELQRLIIHLQKVVKPETNVNRLYI